MPTTDLPVIGTVERKWVYVGGALVAGIVGYAYWKRRQASAAAAGTVDPNAIDPNTGLTYAAEAMQAAGYVNPNPNAVGDATVSGTAAITTDQQWVADVEGKLAGLVDPQFLATTLGKYLAGQPLTTEEAVVVRTAWAFSGHPPGNQQILLASTGPAPGTTPPGGMQTAVRNNNLGATLNSTGFHSWNDLARWAYWWTGHTSSTYDGLFGSLLAHANGQGGGSDPSKIKPIHLPDTLAGTL